METKLQVALGVGGAMIVGLLLELIWGISDRWEATTLVLGVAVGVTLALTPTKEPEQTGYRPVSGPMEPRPEPVARPPAPAGRGAGSTSPVPNVQVGLVTNSNRPPERVTERPDTPPVADPTPTVVITPATPVSVTGDPAPTVVGLDAVQPPPEFFKAPRWELSRPLTDVRHPDAGTEST
jgi:hypothetical protein